MATKSKTQSVPARPMPRLYLATPLVSDPAAIVGTLPDLLAAADVAAVLLRLEPADERETVNRAKAFAPVVQKAGAALLLDGHFESVARAGADGANIRGVSQMEDALAALKPDRILGIGGLETRHDAMLAGESGADYVLFGEPDARGERPSSDAIAERLQWWAELFEPPCVGYAATFDEIAQFTEAGADFILLGDLIWQDSRGAKAALIEAGNLVKAHFGRASGQTAAAEG
jgi:thiamine-phosphate pyrophosphorylase